MNHFSDYGDFALTVDEPAAVRRRGVTFGVTDQQTINSNSHTNGIDEVFQPAGSDFIDGLDFLENCGGNNDDAMEQLQRKSLYVKFDPLCNSPIKSLSDGSETPPPPMITPRISSVADKFDHFDGNDTVTYSQPVTENILNLNNIDLVEPLLYTQSDMDESIKRVRSDFEDDIKAHEMDWQTKYSEIQGNLKEEIAMRELIEKDNVGKLDCLRKDSLDMKEVLSQYEKTIVELTENSHFDKRLNEETLTESIRAKEVLQEEINTAEQNLFDAYKRIEKLKQTVDTLKQNEQTLTKNSIELVSKIEKSEGRYDKLKGHAGDQIESANMIITKVRKQQEIDIAGLQASLKLAQSKVNNLELEIQQKNVENEQLTQISEELINKVSGN